MSNLAKVIVHGRDIVNLWPFRNCTLYFIITLKKLDIVFEFFLLNTLCGTQCTQCSGTQRVITALFNNMRKSSTVKCVFRCRLSSVRRFLPAYGYCRTLFVVWILHNDLITARSTAVESWEGPANIWLTVAKNTFVGWALNFRVRMLLKGAVKRSDCIWKV